MGGSESYATQKERERTRKQDRGQKTVTEKETPQTLGESQESDYQSSFIQLCFTKRTISINWKPLIYRKNNNTSGFSRQKQTKLSITQHTHLNQKWIVQCSGQL